MNTVCILTTSLWPLLVVALVTIVVTTLHVGLYGFCGGDSHS
jgi:hypothetical protein